jgi:hypothetical protein
MEERKQIIAEKLEQKGISLVKAAEEISFNAEVLQLYLAKDAYPVPPRILEKLEALVA